MKTDEAIVKVAERISELVGPTVPVEMEYRFSPTFTNEKGEEVPCRQWRMDVACPSLRKGVEIDGAMFTGGRHGGGRSVVRDMEKQNCAVVLGWCVLHLRPEQLKEGGEGWDWIRCLILGPGTVPVPI